MLELPGRSACKAGCQKQLPHCMCHCLERGIASACVEVDSHPVGAALHVVLCCGQGRALPLIAFLYTRKPSLTLSPCCKPCGWHHHPMTKAATLSMYIGISLTECCGHPNRAADNFSLAAVPPAQTWKPCLRRMCMRASRLSMVLGHNSSDYFDAVDLGEGLTMPAQNGQYEPGYACYLSLQASSPP